MIKYIILTILLLLISLYFYIRFKFRFWFKQPVFHIYNLKYWLFPIGQIKPKLDDKLDKDYNDLSYLYVVQGIKRVLIASNTNNDMYEKTNENHLYCQYSEVDFMNPDYVKFPNYKNVKINEFILKEGDSIFIPQNIWHCVENLEDTLAITYNAFTINYPLIFLPQYLYSLFKYFIGYKINNLSFNIN